MSYHDFCPDSGKVRYDNERLAEERLNRIRHNRKGKRDKTPIRSYYCHACKGYHLTSKVADEHPIELKYKKRFQKLLNNK